MFEVQVHPLYLRLTLPEFQLLLVLREERRWGRDGGADLREAIFSDSPSVDEACECLWFALRLTGLSSGVRRVWVDCGRREGDESEDINKVVLRLHCRSRVDGFLLKMPTRVQIFVFFLKRRWTVTRLVSSVCTCFVAFSR